MVEIRWHGRGGQGAVTSAELVAQAAIAEGKYAQAFPAFGPERRGAPVQSFDRISPSKPIRIRAGITQPDVVVVLDPSLLRVSNVTAGLKEGGTLVINTSKPIGAFESEYGAKWRLATVDASPIAREVLGLDIVNTTMLGAVAKATQLINLESLKEPLKARFGRNAEKNQKAMQQAYDSTVVREMSRVG